MKEIDYFSLDGAALRLFLAVLEEGSVTGAAIWRASPSRRSVTPCANCAASPMTLCSPSRGAASVATAHAHALAARARALLDEMKGFASGASFIRPPPN